MRDRHFPRLCRKCDAPMARQTDACWRCGTRWVDKSVPTGDSPAIRGAAPSHDNPPVAPETAENAGDTQVPALAGAGAAQ
jgi:hypothetical protein